MQTTKKERVLYSVFFLGQNILWTFAGFISTFLLDIGLDAAVASAILLGPKVWDAINDTIFGIIVDRNRWKNGQKFMPWIKIGVAAIGITTILLFAIPKSLTNPAWKIAWFIVAYILFDAAYTLLDAPMFSMPTVMSSNMQERTNIIAGRELWAMVGAILGSILVPLVRPNLGWFWSCVIFVGVGVLLMIPFIFVGRERLTEDPEKQVDASLKEIWAYLKSNKYLFLTLLAMFIFALCSVEQSLSMLMARNCFGNETIATVVTVCVAFPVVIVSAIVPKLAKKFDKFWILIAGMTFSVVMNIICYLIGYKNLILDCIFIGLKCSGMAFHSVVIYMMIADTVEYGAYKSGTKAAGITFSLQTFVAKLKGAVMGSVILAALAIFGYDSSLDDTVIQSASVTNGIWAIFNLMPAIGFTIGIVMLLVFYKLRDKDLQVMASYNNREISKEEAEAALADKFGPAAELK